MRLKKITVSLPSFPFCSVVSALPAQTSAFSTRRFEMNVALRIAEALRLREPQLAFRPSACRSAEMMDGRELPADVARRGP